MPSPTTSPADPIVDRLMATVAPLVVIRHRWRTQGIGGAYLVHLYGVLLALIGLSIVPELFNEDSFIKDIAEALGRAEGIELLWMLVGIALVIALIESGIMTLAWVLMPWGASPEPWRWSMNRGLIRLLQLTPFYAVSLTVFVLVIFLLHDLADNYVGYYDHYGHQRDPVISWRTEQTLTAISSFLYIVSQGVVTLMAIAVHHHRPNWAPSSPWPAECEGCGYQLMGMKRGQTCPECGLDIERSLNTPRSQHDTRGVLTKMWQATLRPTAFGKTIPLYRPTVDHRKALWVGAGMLMATMPVGVFIAWIIFSIDRGYFEFDVFDFDDGYELFQGYLILSSVTLVAAPLLGLLGAALWGAYARLFRRRNALYPAAQVFAYQSGYLAVAVIGLYPVIALVVVIMDSYFGWSPGRASPPAWARLIPLTIPLYFALAAGVGFVLQGLALRGARHGNG